MELLPELRLGWRNGWLLLVTLYGIFGLLLLAFPRPVVRRLYDRSGWERRQRIMRAIGLPFTLGCLALLVLMPLKVGQPVFVIGLVIFALGLAGFVVALINYRNTPLDRPATQGLYRISRNPQVVGLIVALLGVCIAVGSWLAVFLLAVMAVMSHARTLTEERACLAQYGDSYRRYMASVARYFLFF